MEIVINENITIPDRAVKIDFMRSSGPGGQNVNKVETAVQLRFDLNSFEFDNEQVRARLIKFAGSKATKEDEIIIEAKRYRSQEKNRLDAIERLRALFLKALEEPKKRKKSKPGAAAKQKRLEGKKKRSEIKQQRKFRPDF